MRTSQGMLFLPTHCTALSPPFLMSETSLPAYLAGMEYSRLQRSLSLILLSWEKVLESFSEMKTVLGPSTTYSFEPLSGWSGCRGALPVMESMPSMSYLTGSWTKKYLSLTGSMTSLFMPYRLSQEKVMSTDLIPLSTQYLLMASGLMPLLSRALTVPVLTSSHPVYWPSFMLCLMREVFSMVSGMLTSP